MLHNRLVKRLPDGSLPFIYTASPSCMIINKAHIVHPSHTLQPATLPLKTLIQKFKRELVDKVLKEK